MLFEYDDTKSGNEYGIQIYSDNLKKILKIIITALKYHEMPFVSHHGTIFNLCDIYNLKINILPNNGLICIVFNTKYWHSEFSKNGTANNFESLIPVQQKEIIKTIIKDIVEVNSTWNDNNDCHTFSVRINVKTKYKENKSRKLMEKYVNILNSFEN